MRAFTLSLSALGCLVALMLVATGPAKSQPSALALGQASAGGVEEVRYRYRRHRYGYRPYYRPYYRSYGYYRRPYYGYGYGYPYYRRPGISLWFGF
jgi:hypothetical protein